jgi:prepilin-type N-terminal cleavage/methylation domain-containing protein/prepilin-type processing-associated H-X9-DG protein
MSRGNKGSPRIPTVRHGFTMIELVMVIAILGVTFTLLVAATQRARDVALRAQCANNLCQLALALHHYHDLQESFPPGVSTDKLTQPFPWMSWETRLLPYIEQNGMWNQAQSAYQQNPSPFNNPPHVDFGSTVKLYGCPSDPRVSFPEKTHDDLHVGLTSYVGVLGIDYLTRGGVLFADSHIRLVDIIDGTSSTLMVGERPPSADAWYGWWYAGVAQNGSGSPDVVLGVRERQVNGAYLTQCFTGPYQYVPGTPTNQCDVLHFWSLHSGGANFMFADGSVHFLSYRADEILPALATRNGGEVITVDY